MGDLSIVAPSTQGERRSSEGNNVHPNWEFSGSTTGAKPYPKWMVMVMVTGWFRFDGPLGFSTEYDVVVFAQLLEKKLAHAFQRDKQK